MCKVNINCVFVSIKLPNVKIDDYNVGKYRYCGYTNKIND